MCIKSGLLEFHIRLFSNRAFEVVEAERLQIPFLSYQFPGYKVTHSPKQLGMVDDGREGFPLGYKEGPASLPSIRS